MRTLFVISILLLQIACRAQTGNINRSKKLIFEDQFSGSALNSQWIIEQNEKKGSGYSLVDSSFELNTEGGITVWYKNKLQGNLVIEYDRVVMLEGGANDRLSDLNQFWMATDAGGKMFKRKGGFREYDSLNMYYVGMGGNYNTTTRMRRYENGDLKIVGEFTDSAHLLTANKVYHITIVIENGLSKFLVNGVEYFSFKDDKPFKEGWFAIRSTKSRQRIDNFKIWQLD